MTIQILPLTSKGFFASGYFTTINKNILLILPTEEEAINIYKQLQFYASNSLSLLYLPSLDTVPYDRISPNRTILSERIATLSKLAQNFIAEDGQENKLLVTAANNLLCKLPKPTIFAGACLELQKNMRFSAKQLAEFLIKNSFTRNSTAIDDGEFSIRGEIVDVVLSGYCGYRINFCFDSIESIKTYDVFSQISNIPVEKLIIYPASEVLLTEATIKNFKDKYLTTFGVNHTKDPLYESIIQGRKFPAYELLLPLFYKELGSIFDYLKDPIIIYDNMSIQAMIEYEISYDDFYQSRLQSNKINYSSFYPALPTSLLCYSSTEIRDILANDHHLHLEPGNQKITAIDNILFASNLEKKPVTDKLFEIIKEHRNKIIVICCSTLSNIERFKNIASLQEYGHLEIIYLAEAQRGIINLTKMPLVQGFTTDDYLFISEQDIFGEKFAGPAAQNSKRKLKNILTKLDNLNEGELIVHKEHGIGKFISVETIEVMGVWHDCLKILYAEGDKFYLPVEYIESIKKYGDHEVELDKLGNVSWQKRKAKLKNRINEIAAKLLKIAAERKAATTAPIMLDSLNYDKFCQKFTYAETEDQIRSINEITLDLNSSYLMDRLVCGDVGFGKTEIAMRTSYMVCADLQEENPQVAIIVPTTILCKQHYLRFSERFAGFGFKIAQLSRLVKNKEIKQIKQQLESGAINVIVGTHALLAKDINFKNLKLLIVDEEQHFGVTQKERLKELKSKIHVLSLSATPIPRTLQMSMVGLKDLSLIATPPIDRLAIRTSVIPFDAVIIRDALLREHFRGGQSFYVIPRIKDIAAIEAKLKEMVPELKYRIAHGQMPASTIDEVMHEFCEGKFDILISTTIIESGIDIATANTMIIHKADTLGLSQLYQLRGRIGRSKIRGYAYLTLSDKIATKHASRRLEIIQTADTLGAGFTIASHDMDLRGFGNLVGDEQSGHIKEVGVELYQEMLDNAIANLKGELPKHDSEFVPSINLGLAVFIGDHYIADSSLRLGIYRRAGGLLNLEEVEEFKNEMIDRFGPLPKEFENLLNIIKIKQICLKLGIENLDSGPLGFVFQFHKNADVSNMVMEFINKYPRHAKIKPNNKLIYMVNLNSENIILELNKMLKEFRQSDHSLPLA